MRHIFHHIQFIDVLNVRDVGLRARAQKYEHDIHHGVDFTAVEFVVPGSRVRVEKLTVGIGGIEFSGEADACERHGLVLVFDILTFLISLIIRRKATLLRFILDSHLRYDPAMCF